MPFCPKCKSLMLPKDGKFECLKCGNLKARKGTNIVVEKQVKKEMVVLEKRASDEPETRIYRCTKCDHRWRAY